MRRLFLLFWVLCATPAAAQVAMPCDWVARADSIVEPWDENTRTFASGEVRVALLDIVEPAAASFFLLVLHPPYDEVGSRVCTVVGLDEGLGYAGVFFQDIEANYDPARGLTIQMPAIIYLPEQSFQNSALLSVTINQATGNVTVTQELGNE